MGIWVVINDRLIRIINGSFLSQQVIFDLAHLPNLLILSEVHLPESNSFDAFCKATLLYLPLNNYLLFITLIHLLSFILSMYLFSQT